MDRKKHIVFLTGSGISVESGIPTFRVSEDGIWENYPVKEVCTAGCFEVNEERAYRFYAMLHDKYKDCKPNQAHLDIAELEKDYKVTVITQNVDNLHEQAGSTNVLHLHGELAKVRAVDDPSLLWDWDNSVIMHEDTRIEGHQIRPHIVMFGEDVPNIVKAGEVMKTADICVVIGTSMIVYPAAGLVDYVPYGNPIYYIDPCPGKVSDLCVADLVEIKKTATEGMKELKEKLRGN